MYLRFVACVYGLVLVLSNIGFCQATETQTEADLANYLKQLELPQMMAIEVTLDDAFDLFDGLVHAQKISLASGVLQSRQQAPAVTTVLTRQDIEAIGARNIDEVLEMVPGLHVGKDFINGNPIYSIRGIHTGGNTEVLLMINGIRIKSLVSGNQGFYWGGMPVQSIERIEVIRGPGSALHGADALAGVINIITRQGRDIEGTELGLQVGSFDTQSLWVVHGGQYGQLELAASLEVSDTDGAGELIKADAQTELDQRFGTNASQAPGPINDGRSMLDARLDLTYNNWRAQLAYQQRDDLGTYLGFAQALDPFSTSSSERWSADLEYQRRALWPHWDLQAKIGYLRFIDTPENTHLYPPGSFNGLFPDGLISYSHVIENQTHLAVSASYRGWKRHLLRLGIGYHYANLEETNSFQNFILEPNSLMPRPLASVQHLTGEQVLMEPQERQNWHFFIQDSWQLRPTLALTTGLRYDEYSDFGRTFNPRFALVWQVTDRLSSKLLYGQAFRAPSFVQLYIKNSLLTTGNPALGPEELEMWELAFDYLASDRVYASFNIFHYDITNKITYPFTRLPAKNTESQRGYGLETELRWKFDPRASALINYAWQRSKEAQDEFVPDGWQQTLFIRLDWLIQPHWYLNSTLRWIADRPRHILDTRPPLDNFTIVDLTLRRKVIAKNHWNLALGIRNLFDRDAREPVTYGLGVPDDLPLPSRHWFFELRYQF